MAQHLTATKLKVVLVVVEVMEAIPAVAKALEAVEADIQGVVMEEIPVILIGVEAAVEALLSPQAQH